MDTDTEHLQKLEAVLDFYLASGADAFLGDAPVDWFELTREQARDRTTGSHARTAPASAPTAAVSSPAAMTATRQNETAVRQPAAPKPAAQAPTAVIPDQEVVAAAREMASMAGSLDDLRGCLASFDGCNLKLTAKSLVFADGNPNAKVMLVGEAPGRDEDMQGTPFVGRSGMLLDKMLQAIDLDRSSAYIANVVPWRPPGNRTPTPQETEICKPFIQRQIELVNPDVLVFLGAASAKTLLGVQDGIRKMRGRWMSYPLPGREISAVATYHPAYLLRSPLEKRLSWRDFLSIQARLRSAG